MSSEEFKAEGNKYFAAKDFEKAIEYFTKAIDASPEPNHVLYSNRSASYASLKNFPKALEDAEACVKTNATWAKGYNRVAAAHYGLGNLDDAKQQYEKALQLDSNNAMAKDGLKSVENAIQSRNAQPDMGLGAIFSDPNLITNLKNNPKTKELMKDPELVNKLVQIQTNPKANATQFLSDPRLMTIMATLMGIDMDAPEPPMPSSSKPEEPSQPKSQPEPKSEPKSQPVPKSESVPKSQPKEEKVEEDVEMSDGEKETADQLKAEGNTLYKAKKFDEAIAKYNSAWETFKDITYLNNRSAAEYEKGDYDAAIKTCNLAIDEGRDMRADYKLIAKAFTRLGNTYLKKGDLHEAAKYFDKSLTEHRTPDVLNKLRSTQKEIKVKEAQEYINPEKAEEARLEGKDYFTKGDWPNAVKAYSEMIKRAPEDARGYSNRAAALAKLMSFPDAVQDCNKAIEKDPNFIRAYIRKANAQLAMKEYASVMETLNDAREKDMELGGKNLSEIDQLYNKANSSRFQGIEGETPEQTMERVSRDPEIVKILQDPIMQGILGQARDNPAALQEHMKNPEVSKKINMLIAAGVIRTR
ncbi:heat shock protein Sti1p [[Candida] jaroonii]|uniref:Heat shock protein Sti1p n=1 Tax=[Candida] jaroonii TaxID=467808 RepID=A0ACA9Y5D2_9ASCO|nr:heat shock protein Sti1p [[Candida] jaroonii]